MVIGDKRVEVRHNKDGSSIDEHDEAASHLILVGAEMSDKSFVSLELFGFHEMMESAVNEHDHGEGHVEANIRDTKIKFVGHHDFMPNTELSMNNTLRVSEDFRVPVLVKLFEESIIRSNGWGLTAILIVIVAFLVT